MNRVIKNYANISKVHIDLITKAYPEGFSDEDLKAFSMPNGKFLRCLEVRTLDTVYLFKIDEEMVEILEEATDSEFDIDIDGEEVE
jgi:DNA-directed RNA polymerase subunit delta